MIWRCGARRGKAGFGMLWCGGVGLGEPRQGELRCAAARHDVARQAQVWRGMLRVGRGVLRQAMMRYGSVWLGGLGVFDLY